MHIYEADDLSLSAAIWSTEPTGEQCSCIDISRDEEYVAYSNKPGILTVAKTNTGQVKYSIEQTYTSSHIVACKYIPTDPNMILYTCKDGFLFLYDLFNLKFAGMARHLGTSVLLTALDSYGENFTIACADGSLRIYDIETMQRTKALVKSANQRTTTATQSIYSLVYHPTDSNILVTASGKDNIFIWDIRSGSTERSIFGPHIRGNGVDIHDNTIITASYRDSKQVEMWDFGTGRKIKEIHVDSGSQQKGCFCTMVKIAENGFDFVVGGTEINSLLAYEFRKNGMFGQTSQFKEPLSACAVSAFGTTIVAGSDTGAITCHMVRVKEDEDDEDAEDDEIYGNDENYGNVDNNVNITNNENYENNDKNDKNVNDAKDVNVINVINVNDVNIINVNDANDENGLNDAKDNAK